MYKVYGPPSSRATRVIWMLEELGADYTVEPKKPHTPEVLAVNPGGKVPVLMDGDVTVYDSSAILFYLADKHGALTFPLNSPERTEMTSLIFFAVDEIEQSLWTCAKHSFILPDELRALEAVTPACHHEFANAVETFSTRLGERRYAMGDTFTIADIIIGHLLGWAMSNKFPEPDERVAAYVERVRARDSWLKLKEILSAA